MPAQFAGTYLTASGSPFPATRSSRLLATNADQAAPEAATTPSTTVPSFARGDAELKLTAVTSLLAHAAGIRRLRPYDPPWSAAQAAPGSPMPAGDLGRSEARKVLIIIW